MSIKNLLQLFGYLIVGIAVGYISWGHSLPLTVIAAFVIVFYFIADKRTTFFLFVFGYYLGASRGLFLGTIVYYNIFVASGVYVGAALLTSLAWIVFWGKSLKTKLLSFVGVQLLLVAPPLGYISWVNPILSAGLIAPKLGFYGFFIELFFYYF